MQNYAIGLILAGAISLCGSSVVLAADEAPVTLQRSFPAGKVIVDGFRGTLTITAAPAGAAVTIRATGRPDTMKTLDVRQGDGGVLIKMVSHSKSVWWPWSVLDWSQPRMDDIVMTIGAPKGTEFDMDEVGGRISAGDLDAPLRFGGIGGGGASFGNVTRARVSVAGSMDVKLGNIQGALDADIAGSGSIKAGNVLDIQLDIAGNGDFVAGAVTRGFDADIAGSGNATINSVNGPVSVDIAGTGDVVIKAGRADPLKVSIAGSGNIDFGGEAVNPDVSIAGSGDVRVGSMSGTLKQDIQGSGGLRIVPAPKPVQPLPATPAQSEPLSQP